MFGLVTTHPLADAGRLEAYVANGASARWSSPAGARSSQVFAEACAAWPSATMLIHGVVSMPPTHALSSDRWDGFLAALRIQMHGTNAENLWWTAATHQWTQCEHLHYLSMVAEPVDIGFVRGFRHAIKVASAAVGGFPAITRGPGSQRRHRRLRRFQKTPYALSDAELAWIRHLGWDVRVLGEFHEELRVITADDGDRLIRAAAAGYRLEWVVPGGVDVIGLPAADISNLATMSTAAWSAQLDGVWHSWYWVHTLLPWGTNPHDRLAAVRLALLADYQMRGVNIHRIIHRRTLPLRGPGWFSRDQIPDRRASPVIIDARQTLSALHTPISHLPKCTTHGPSLTR